MLHVHDETHKVVTLRTVVRLDLQLSMFIVYVFVITDITCFLVLLHIMYFMSSREKDVMISGSL